MSPGITYIVRTVDGDDFQGVFLRTELGFLVLEVEGAERPIRWSSIRVMQECKKSPEELV